MLNETPQLLYLLDEDLFRFGNAASPKLHNVRDDDVDVYDHAGFAFVRANGKGISLITEKRLPRGSGYIWKLPAHTQILPGLGLNPDIAKLKPGELPDHYLLCPLRDMARTEYVYLLEKQAMKLERIRKQ